MAGDMKPFRIAGNLYFVGTYAASSHLIDTGDGLILIDTGYAETADVIVESMRELGFRIEDVKMILHSHGHGDHTFGTPKLLSLCHAQTWLRHEDLRYLNGIFTPDHDFENGEVIRLGNTEITILHTPGHTVGTVSFFFNVTENGKVLRCGMFGGAGTKQLTAKYLARNRLSLDQRRMFFESIYRLRGEHVDLFVGNHSWHNHYRENSALLGTSEKNPFIDAERWPAFLEKTRAAMEKIIREESREEFVNYAHRGASAYCPENTFLSFYTGIYMGANGIETDVRLTKDGQAVLFHDKTLERVTGESGAVEDYVYDELKDFKVKNGDLADFIPRLDDFLSHFGRRSGSLAIEIKGDGAEAETVRLIREKCKISKVRVTSFDMEKLKTVHALDPELMLGYLCHGEITEEVLSLCRENGIDEICPEASVITPGKVDYWHHAGFRVRAWGVRTEEDMKNVFDSGADGMTCNFPDKLAELMKN